MCCYEFSRAISLRRFHPINNPKKMLKSPASKRIIPLIAEKRRAVMMKGKLIAALINSMPPIVPMPKSASHINPSATDGIVARAASVITALPASP